MDFDCQPLAGLPRTSKLFADYLENFTKVQKFYGHSPDDAGVQAAAREVRLDEKARAAVVEVLREQNARVAGAGGGIDPSVEKNIDRLAKGAVAVVTGQQVGLFGGPAYSFYKALSAIAWAEKLTTSGTEAVPVFWMATEDHDIAEVDHCFWTVPAGLERLSVPVDSRFTGHQAGEVVLGEQAEAVVKEATAALGEVGKGTAEIKRILRESYSAEDTFGTAFAKLMARAMAGRGLILLDPRDSRLHKIAAPIVARAIQDAKGLREALLERGKELGKAGFHVQVKVAGETTLLFMQQDGRREALRASGEKFKAGKKGYTLAELMERLEREPEAFTPSALLRPVVQDALLPTAAYVGGPAEVAYYAETEVLYRKLAGRMPAILPRASFTIVEPHVKRLLRKYKMSLRDIFEGRQAVRSALAKGSLPSGLSRRFAADEREMTRSLEKYRAFLQKLDKTLVGALETAERKIAYQLTRLKTKAGRAEGFRKGVIEKHEKILMESLWPEKALQEREVCLVPMLARYGMELLDELEEHAADVPARHCVVTL
jgi:bacillithiol biosynthesis cysteine-adding enzyme BshC